MQDTIRHYCDFSGYMDIIIGVSEIMGVELEDNFKQPFFSKNAAEFWRRWHITLGVWFKDYVYMPLVISPKLIKLSGIVRKKFGKRQGKAVLTVIPLLCVWLLTGIWHGTGIDYILWGLYWGVIIIISNVFAPEIKKLTDKLRINTEAADWKFFQMCRTFALFVIGLLLSTLVGVRGLWHYGGTVLKRFRLYELLSGKLTTYGLTASEIYILLTAILILFIGEVLQTTGSVREKIAGLHAIPRWIIYATGLFILVLFGVYGAGYDASDFAYMFF